MKTILIRLAIVAVILLSCVLLSSCNNNHHPRTVYVIDYTSFVKNDNRMDALDSGTVVIKADDKYEMQRLFDTTIAMKYDCDSIAMHTTVSAIFQ